MVVYVVCFDLAAPLETQRQQVTYWLDFLNSSLPTVLSTSIPKWKVMIVGTRKDRCEDSFLSSDIIPSWKSKWTNLPIHDQLFLVSAFSKEGVRGLLQSIEGTCNEIFFHHTTLIPALYKIILNSIATDKSYPILSIERLAKTHA